MSPEQQAVRLFSELFYGKSKRAKALSKARQRDRRQAQRWGWRAHIRGIGAGIKLTNRQSVEGVRCLTIYVRRKLPERRIPAEERIPKKLGLASLGIDVLTDVVELRGRIIAHAASLIQPGNEVGHQFGEPGTLGLLVRKGASPDVLALGCSHVLARSGVEAAENDLVEHPLDLNADPELNRFGQLTEDFTRLSRDEKTSEDFALAKVEVRWVPALADSGAVVSGIVGSGADIAEGTATLMNGVKTKDAHGAILNNNWSGTFSDVPFVGDVDFENLVSYQTACQPGDSGAVVLQDGTTMAFGIHLGGSSQDSFGLLMPLGPVFDRLGLQLVTKEGAA